MNKTREQRHNEMLDKIVDPEINRLKKVEAVASEILTELKSEGYIKYYKDSECYLINTIQRVISKNTILKES